MIRRADVQQNLPGQIFRIQTVDPGLVQQNQQLPAQPFLLGGGFRGAQPHEGVYLHFQITHILFLLMYKLHKIPKCSRIKEKA